MKKIALVATFCNTPDKIELLEKTLTRLSSLSIDSIILTSIDLPFSVIRLATYCFVTKENPIVKWPEYARLSRKTFTENQKSITLIKGLIDYGFAHAWQYKKMSQIALTYEYDAFYLINYDLNFDEAVIQSLSAERVVCNIWGYNRSLNALANSKPENFQGSPSFGGDFKAKATLNFICFNRENLIKFNSLISRDQYVSHICQTSDSAEEWLEKLCRPDFNQYFEDHQTTDLAISSTCDLHNISKIDTVKAFIQKCNLNRFDINLLIYGFTGQKTIIVRTNLGENIYTGESPCLFTLCLDSDELLTSAIINVDGSSQEIINEIRETDINQILI